MFTSARILLIFAFTLFFVGPSIAEQTTDPANQDLSILLEPETELSTENTSMKEFFPNLKNNFAGIFTRQSLQPLLIGSVGAALGSTADDEVHGFFSERNTSAELGNVGQTLGRPFVVVPSIVGLLIAGQNTENRKFRHFTYALAQAYTINYGLTTGLKRATDRLRPNGSNDHSFPSGHSSDAFMVATVVHQYYGKRAGIIGYTTAAFVAASRLKKDAHWLSDVVAGSTLGYIVGRAVCRKTGGIDNKKQLEFQVVPAVSPSSRTLGLQLHLAF